MTNASNNPTPTGREQLTAAIARLSAAHAAELSEFGPQPTHNDECIARDQMDVWRINNRIVVGEDRDRVAEDEAHAYRLEAARRAQVDRWRDTHRCVHGTPDAERVEADERDAYREHAARNAWYLVEKASEAWGVEEEPLPARVPGRAQVIAAIHAYADWLTANPAIPVPDSIDANCYHRESHEPDPRMREAYVRAWAAQHGAVALDGHLSIWAELPIATEAEQGIRINHVILSNLENGPAL